MAKDERGKEQKKWEVGSPRVNSSRLKVTRWWWELGEHDESQAHTEHLCTLEDLCTFEGDSAQLSHQDLGKGNDSSNSLVGKTCSMHGPSSSGIQVCGDTALPRPFNFTGKGVEQSPVTPSASLSWITEARNGGAGRRKRS